MDATDTDTAEGAGKTSAPDADDMLAQLAGDEIDRLLAEAETDAAPSPVAAAPLDAPRDETPATEVPAPPTAEASTDGTNELAKDLDQLVGSASEPAAENESPATVMDAATELIPSAQTVAPVAVAESTSEKPPATSDAKSEESATPAPAVEPVPSVLSADEADDVPDTNRLPLYLRIFNAIVAPLEAIPDPLRDAIGKVAVVTLVNAIGVILYVMIFRHHHHK